MLDARNSDFVLTVDTVGKNGSVCRPGQGPAQSAASSARIMKDRISLGFNGPRVHLLTLRLHSPRRALAADRRRRLSGRRGTCRTPASLSTVTVTPPAVTGRRPPEAA